MMQLMKRDWVWTCCGNAAYADEVTEADKDLSGNNMNLFHGSLPNVLRWLKQRRMLSNMKHETPFSRQLQLHSLWMIADKEEMHRCRIHERRNALCMMILLAYLQIILHSPVRCLHNNFAGVSRKQPVFAECWSWIPFMKEWVDREFREIFLKPVKDL